MRFLADLGAAGSVATWLRSAGHDVREVAEQDIRMDDPDILAWALREARIIITTDKDFEAIIYRENRHHCGLLRLQNLPRIRRIQLLDRVMADFAAALAEGNIVIADEAKIRIRHSPPDISTDG